MKPCAAILAGGLGTRLRSIVGDRPKVMAMVAGRPFMTYILDQLVETGVRRVVLCTGHLARTIEDELGENYCGMELFHSKENTPLGTGGALHHAAGLLSGDMILVLNGDSYCHCNLGGFITEHAKSGAQAGIALVQVDDVSRFGAVLTNGRSLIVNFAEKGNQAGPGWINAGIYLFPVRMIREFASGRQISLEREVFPTIISRGLYGYHCTGPFIDIGVPEEFRRAQLFFGSNKKGCI